MKPQSNTQLFHTYEWKCSRHFYKEFTAGKNVFTHTHSQLQLLRVSGTCSHKVLHCLNSSRHTISHQCFVTATCPAKVYLLELHAACCSNESCKEDVFYRVNSSGSCVRGLLRDLTNHRQQTNGKTILSSFQYFHVPPPLHLVIFLIDSFEMLLVVFTSSSSSLLLSSS